MRYLCTNCSYIYDESLWDEVENIKSWTKFYKLGDNFKCPVCWEDQDSFQEIIDEVNYIDENNILWSIDLEHFINIEDLWGWRIEVSVGKDSLHPSEKEHRITSITLLDEYWDIVSEEFLQVWQDPIVEFDVSDLDEYEIQARCNIHGLWGRKVKNSK